MRNWKNVNRVEKLYYKLCNLNKINKSHNEPKIIYYDRYFKRTNFSSLYKKFNRPIKNIVKARNPSTFKQAKQIEKSEEIEFLSEQKVHEKRNKNNNFSNNN